MTNFINPGYSIEHRGAQRLELLGDALMRLGRQFRGGKVMVAMLLAGVISALVVVADQIVTTWTDGHLLMAWVTLWALVFAALAMFAYATHGWTARLQTGLQQWSERARERAQDQRVWAVAQSDPRFMADIQAARFRAETEAVDLNQSLPSWSFLDRSTHTMHFRSW